MRNRLIAAAAGIAAVTAIALIPAAAADAHDYLVGSDPSSGSTVTTALTSVTLTFNDRVLDLSGNGSTNLLTVTGPGSAPRHFETGCATVADTKLSAPVALGPSGTYTVTYQIVSADGHTVSSSYPFAYQAPAGATAAAGTGKSPCGEPASAASTPAATGSGSAASGAPAATASTPQPTTAASNGTDLGLVIGIAIAIVVLAVIGVVIVLVTARRRPPTGSEGAATDERED